MSNEKVIVTLNTIQFMLTDTAHYKEYAEALCQAKDAIRNAAGPKYHKCIGRPLKREGD